MLMSSRWRHWIAVIGSTGTGKSDVALALARRFHGEIINMDAMQMYRHLGIATNRPTSDDMDGVPHHLFGVLGVEAQYSANSFVSDALSLMEQIWSRDRIPILVGGTHYYLVQLLYESHIQADVPHEMSTSSKDGEEDVSQLYEELRLIDPWMAERLHPRDIRKIRRSLEIYRHTGRRHSEFLQSSISQLSNSGSECSGGKDFAVDSCSVGGKDSVHFPMALDSLHNSSIRKRRFERDQVGIVHLVCDSDDLNLRLEKRSLGMVERGLVDELVDVVFECKRVGIDPFDPTRGVLQSIGCRQFYSVIEQSIEDRNHNGDENSCIAGIQPASAVPNAGNDEHRTVELREACSLLTQHTVRYAKKQQKYIRSQILPQAGEDFWYSQVNTSLASTSCSIAGASLNDKLEQIFLFVEGLLRGTLPGSNFEEMAVQMQQEAKQRKKTDASLLSRTKYFCETCNQHIIGESQWEKHLRSRHHRRQLSRIGNRKAVAEESTSSNTIENGSDDGVLR